MNDVDARLKPKCGTEVHEERGELREVDGKKVWYVACEKEGWSPIDGAVEFNPDHFAVGTMVVVSEPCPECGTATPGHPPLDVALDCQRVGAHGER